MNDFNDMNGFYSKDDSILNIQIDGKTIEVRHYKNFTEFYVDGKLTDAYDQRKKLPTNTFLRIFEFRPDSKKQYIIKENLEKILKKVPDEYRFEVQTNVGLALSDTKTAYETARE